MPIGIIRPNKAARLFVATVPVVMRELSFILGAQNYEHFLQIAASYHGDANNTSSLASVVPETTKMKMQQETPFGKLANQRSTVCTLLSLSSVYKDYL